MTTPPGHRGVWTAPWSGPNGELVLYAMDSRTHLVAPPFAVSADNDHVAAADKLWDLIDERDPQQPSFVGRAPRFRFVPRRARAVLRGRTGGSLKLKLVT